MVINKKTTPNTIVTNMVEYKTPSAVNSKYTTKTTVAPWLVLHVER